MRIDTGTRSVEALLLLVSDPVEASALASATGLDERQVLTCLELLERGYEEENRGIRLERSGSGFRLVTAPEAGAVVAHFQGLDRAQKLSAAALDALAIVAYRQPVTRSTIESVRGVGSEHVLAVLLNAGLIEELGRAESVGRPVLYGTTPSFLEAIGITSLSGLPELEESPG